MPLPLIILGGAAIAGATGIANGANGAKKMIRSGKAKKEIGSQHDANVELYQTKLNEATLNMDALGVALKPYHVSSEFLSAAGDKYGYDFKGSLTGDKAVCLVFDNSKIKRIAPEMTTHIPFHRGVERALSYVFAHPEEYEEDPEFDAWCDRVIGALEKAKAAI